VCVTLAEYYLHDILYPRYGKKSKVELWKNFFEDPKTNGPQLLTCVGKMNHNVRNSQAAAVRLEGLFSSLSGDHHHSSALDIAEDSTRKVIISSVLSADQRALLKCLCTWAHPAPIPFEVMGEEDHVDAVVGAP
jgi:hypothetical protein